MSLMIDTDILLEAAGLREYKVPAPHEWIQERLHEHVWSKQIDVCESVVRQRYTTVRSAHGTGKSFIASRLASWWLDVHPVGQAFVVTSAPTDKQVKAILWREIGRAHRKGALKGRVNLDAEWIIGQELVAYGRKPADYTDVDAARQAFQGIHAKWVLVILDEACGIPQWLWEATDTLVTNDHSRVLAIGNPDDPSSEFEKTHRPGSGWNQIHISAFDLPCYTGEHVPAELHDLLTGKTWVEERKRKWGEGSPLYISKVLGNFPEISDDTLITPSMVRRAQALELPGLGLGRYGADIARKGADETVVYRNRDGVMRRVYSAHKQDTMRTAGALAKILREHGNNYVPMAIDMIGVGAGVFDRLIEQGLSVLGFDAGGAPFDKTRYINRRAEVYWELRQAFEQGEIDLDIEDDDLAAQLQSIKWKLDSRGRIGIESKDDMRKRGLPSPDRADAVMMAHAHPSSVPDLGDVEIEPGLTDDLMGRTF